jgi:Protein of unknown function (DUF3014)
MSRYDRNRSKKSDHSSFIIAILISLLIGISGTDYVMENYKNLKALVAADSKSATSNEIAVSEKFPDEPQDALEDKSELLLDAPEPVVPVNNESESQKSGLPDLLSSDDALRRALKTLSPGLMQWLNTDQLIRRYVIIANDFSQGLRISKHVSFLRLVQPFAVEQGENGLQIAPKSYQRYDKLAQAINIIDAKAAVALYQNFRPLMLQVFAEFSYPKDITLESIVNKAASEILAAPAIEGQVVLVRPSLYYKFADPKLEALNPVQKQMIRMGAGNTRIIQNKCREFLVALGKSGVR